MATAAAQSPILATNGRFNLTLDTLNLDPHQNLRREANSPSKYKYMTPLPSPQVSTFERSSPSMRSQVSGGKRTHEFFGSPVSPSVPLSLSAGPSSERSFSNGRPRATSSLSSTSVHTDDSKPPSPTDFWASPSSKNDTKALDEKVSNLPSALLTSPPRKTKIGHSSYLGIGESPSKRNYLPNENISRLPSLVPDKLSRSSTKDSLMKEPITRAESPMYSSDPEDEVNELKPETCLNNEYTIERQIGTGAFSKVVLVRRDQPLDAKGKAKELLAVKMIDRKTVEQNDRMRISVLREVEVLKHIHHPSLVHLIDSFTISRYTCLVLEYAAGGELFDLVTQHYANITDALVRRIFGELSDVIGWMHSIGLVHRDIKLENILLTRDPLPLTTTDTLSQIQTPLIKVTDFGLSRFIDLSDPILRTRCGSEEYAAPELIMGQAYDGRQTDAWALGVVLYTLLTGTLPFLSASIINSDGIQHEELNRSDSSNGGSRPSTPSHLTSDHLPSRQSRRSRLMRIAKADYQWPSENDCPLATLEARRVADRLLLRDATLRATVDEVWETGFLSGPRSLLRRSRKRTSSSKGSVSGNTAQNQDSSRTGEPGRISSEEEDDSEVWVKVSTDRKDEEILHAEVEPL